jgi:thioredoxin reductase
VLLATGLELEFPKVEGMAELYGHGVYDCPYCDGWDHRDQPIAVYGPGNRGHGFAIELLGWSRDLVLLTGGPADLKAEERQQLDRHGIRLIEDKVAAVEGGPDGLERIRFADGATIERRALFFCPEDRRISALAERLGCELMESGVADATAYGKTNVPGVYIAGDASRRVHFAIVAAAEGAMAGFALNTELLHEDLGPPPQGGRESAQGAPLPLFGGCRLIGTAGDGVLSQEPPAAIPRPCQLPSS